MCGISLILKKKKKINLNTTINNMMSALSHRGPDGRHNWINEEMGVAIGHNRLSIIDLSINGRQPIQSQGNRYIISYNGEIYNFHKLKKIIDEKFKINWLGHSDTEVLINYIELFGLDHALDIIDGMYSFILLDRKLNKIFLVRDRFGEKPMFYYKDNNLFAAASEIKSILSIGGANVFSTISFC